MHDKMAAVRIAIKYIMQEILQKLLTIYGDNYFRSYCEVYLAIIASRSMSNNDIYFGSETISTMINISVVKPCSSNTMQQGNKHK